jgi:hypothetical protein
MTAAEQLMSLASEVSTFCPLTARELTRLVMQMSADALMAQQRAVEDVLSGHRATMRVNNDEWRGLLERTVRIRSMN